MTSPRQDPVRPSSARRTAALALAAVLWVAAAAGGLAVLARYATAGRVGGATPSHWPSGSAIERPEGKACAIVFLHPRCPCSAATLSELGRVLAHAPRGARVVIAFFAPLHEGPDWGDTGLRSRAESLPGVIVVDDSDGQEATRFGAATSGHVVAYAPDGSLTFQGGITPSRGHEGDNAGAAGLLAALSGRSPHASATPVYGCEIAGCELPHGEETP